MSSADAQPPSGKTGTEPESPKNPFKGKPAEANLVVDVTPEPERSEDLSHPKRKSEEEEEVSPDPHKRPKTSEDFSENSEVLKSPEDQESSQDKLEQRELQYTACAQAINQVESIKDEAAKHFRGGDFFKALSKYEDAIGAFQKVLVPRESLDKCQKLRSQLLSNIALCCFNIKDYSLALKVAEQGVKEFPEDKKLIYSYAKALCHEGEYDRAIAHMKRLTRAYPNDQTFVTKIKEIQQEKEDHMNKLREMYGGKLLAPVAKDPVPEQESSSYLTWGLIAAFAGLAIGGVYLARKYFARKS